MLQNLEWESRFLLVFQIAISNGNYIDPNHTMNINKRCKIDVISLHLKIS